MIKEDSLSIILSSTLFSSTFLDWLANLNVDRVCVKLISAGLMVQIKIVWLLVVREDERTRVSLESLKGTWPLFFCESLWTTFDKTNRLLLIYPVYSFES